MAAGSLVFPVLGVVLSNALYFSSTPAVLRAYRLGNLGSLNPLPQALMVISTNAWMCYALAVPNFFIVASNLPGAIAAVAFVAVTLPLVPREQVTTRTQVQFVLVFGSTATYTLWAGMTWLRLDHDARCFWLGAYGSAICVLLFASPLSTLREVLASANAASIYGPLTATQCTNCAMWTIYGLGIGDIWVYGPNAIGLALGIVQLALKLIFPSTPKRLEEQQVLFRKDTGSDDDTNGRGHP